MKKLCSDPVICSLADPVFNPIDDKVFDGKAVDAAWRLDLAAADRGIPSARPDRSDRADPAKTAVGPDPIAAPSDLPESAMPSFELPRAVGKPDDRGHFAVFDAIPAPDSPAEFDLVEHHYTCPCAACAGHRDPDAENQTSGSAGTQSNTAPAGQLSEMADFLLTGYWNTNYGDGTRSHNVTGSGFDANNGVLHYNLSGYSSDADGLTSARADLVREAFKLYEATLGIRFVETSSTDTSLVDFFFSDNSSGAYASHSYSNSGAWGSSITSARINVAADWYGGRSGYDTYTLQTVLHEIGHAIGLGHQGSYNGSASYGTDNTFANDSWQASMMSYFSQSDNTFISGSYEFLQTPMVVDWLALDTLYGRQGYGTSNAFTGNTVWGFNTNITSDVSDIWASWSSWGHRTASTIVDGGGMDTLDLSGYSNNTLINLAPSDPGSTTPSLSNIGGRIGNLSIASGTVIENAIGGVGNETFYGNAADNVLTGNGGNDTFHDSVGSDTYRGGDGTDYVIFGASFAEYSYALVNGLLQVANTVADWVESTVEWLTFRDQTLSWQAVVDGIGGNVAPAAVNDSFTTGEGDVVSGSVLINDSDADGDALSVTAVNGSASAVGTALTLASGAVVTLNADGTFGYDPNGAFDGLNDGQSATDSFTYQISDGEDTDTATVRLTIEGVTPNVAPVAADDSFTTGEGDVVSGSVLANDSDANGDALSVIAVNGLDSAVGTALTLASGAVVTLNADGTFDYDPNGAFDGLNDGQSATDSFTYRISDGQGSSDSASVTLIIEGASPNAAPVAANDAFAVAEDVVLQGSGILDNDTDADGDALSVASVQGLAVGSGGTSVALASGAVVTMFADGRFDYDQNGAFDALGVGQQATDSFTYRASDGKITSAPATVTITIDGAFDNTAPVAVNDNFTMGESDMVTGSVLTNDSDPDGDTLVVTALNGAAAALGTATTLASGALVTLNADGSFDYDPNGAFDALNTGQSATDRFTYAIADGQGGTDTATVTMTINGVSPPVITRSLTLTFEDESTGSFGGVDGLAFSGLNVAATSILSGARAGSAGRDGDFTIRLDEGEFDLNSLTMINDGKGRQKVLFSAYDDGVLSGSLQVNVGARKAKQVNFDSSFDGVDEIIVTGRSNWYVDNLDLTTRMPAEANTDVFDFDLAGVGGAGDLIMLC